MQAARDAVTAQEGVLLDARNAEKAALGSVTAALASWLLEDPSLDVGRLEARVPIVLLPLRLETRFAPNGQQLLVRIYPDEISADAHEPDLSNAEIDAGSAYWQAAQTAGSEQLAAWQTLVQTYPSQRAAWIVRITDPKLTTKPATFNKPSGWSRAVEARLLPDRFVVVAERTVQGVTTTRRAVGTPVVEPLALSVGPDTLGADQTNIGPDGTFKLDDAVQWTVDFDRAVSVGMGIRLPIEANDLQLGFDRVIVLGVKTSLDAEAGASQLGTLLDAQHYTAGLAFVKQGSPTSNVAGTPAAFPPADDNNSHSFAVERGATPLDNTAYCAGQNLALALGLPYGILSHVEGADLQELAPARAMSRVLYSATFGYFLDQIMSPLVPPDAVNQIGQHFATWVVPRGVSSAFRVGRVPYGILPVTSLARWQERRGTNAAHQRMVSVLQGVKKNWMAGVSFAPHVGATPNDPDKDLLDVLAMDASARQVRVRRVIGEDTYANLLDLLDLPRTVWENQHRLIGAFALDAAGIPVVGVNPRVLGMNYNVDSRPYHGTLVELDDAISEMAGLQFNYIDWVRGATIQQLGAEQLPGGFPAGVKQLLLYRLMRHTALTEYHWWAGRLIAAFPTTALSPTATIDPNWREPELVKIVPGTENDQTPFERFTNRVTLPAGGTDRDQRDSRRRFRGAAHAHRSRRFPDRASNAPGVAHCGAAANLHRVARRLLASRRRVDDVARQRAAVAAARVRRLRADLLRRCLRLRREPQAGAGHDGEAAERPDDAHDPGWLRAGADDGACDDRGCAAQCVHDAFQRDRFAVCHRHVVGSGAHGPLPARQRTQRAAPRCRARLPDRAWDP